MAHSKGNDAERTLVSTKLPEPSQNTNLTRTVYDALHTLWLFTLSDWEAIIIPQALLTLANAESGRFVLGSASTNTVTSRADVLVCMLLADDADPRHRQ